MIQNLYQKFSNKNTSATYYKLPHEFSDWDSTQKCLRNILQLKDLEAILKQINKINEDNSWSVKSITDCQYQEEKIIALLKFAAQCCLQVKSLFPNRLPISHPIDTPNGITSTVLTKRQALCLVANMFFSTTHTQPDKKDLPIFFSYIRLSRRPNQITKTMFNYFDRSQNNFKNLDKQSIIFFRIAETIPFQQWSQCEQKLCQVRFHTQGAIQDLKDSIQIDFANKSIGGFFLSQTYTQQDIIFINNPELMPAVLFHKYMKANQCILMVGAERFSVYKGYLQTYEYAGNFQDDRKIIKLELEEKQIIKVKDTWISAIDAIPFFVQSQFNYVNLSRQLNKAYVGFNIMRLDNGNKPISTGNWGSGAFNGNLEYKFLIQWLAASKAKRTIDYFSFDDIKAKQIPQIIQKFKNYTVKQLFNCLLTNADAFQQTKRVFKVLLNSLKKVNMPVIDQ